MYFTNPKEHDKLGLKLSECYYHVIGLSLDTNDFLL